MYFLILEILKKLTTWHVRVTESRAGVWELREILKAPWGDGQRLARVEARSPGLGFFLDAKEFTEGCLAGAMCPVP